MRRFSTILVACLTATLAFAGSSCGTPPSPRAAGTVAQTTALDAQAATAAPRAGTISLSLTSSGRLKLHIVAVDAAGRPVPSALRVTVGTTTKRGSGTVVRRDARTVHDLLLPGLRKPGGVYYYDVRLRAGDTGRTYPATGRYRVIAPVGAEQPLTMVAWSDSQPDSSSVTARPSPVFAKMIGNALAKRPRPALALVAGDVLKVDDDDPRQTLDAKYLRFLSVENRLARRLPVMIAPGNHEELGVPGPLAAWGRWLGLPTTVDAGRRFYSFTDGDVHVVALATAGTGDDGTIGYFGPGDKRNSAQARWLEDDLGAAGDRWTIVFAHHPLFDPKPDDPYATSAERDALNALFAASGVDLVIQGHLHSYRRHQEPVSFAGAAGSLTYVTHGGLGGDLRPTDYAPPDAYDVARDRAYTYLIVRSDGRGSLTGTTYAVDAVTGVETVLEAFAVDQVPRGAGGVPHGAPAAPPPAVSPNPRRSLAATSRSPRQPPSGPIVPPVVARWPRTCLAPSCVVACALSPPTGRGAKGSSRPPHSRRMVKRALVLAVLLSLAFAAVAEAANPHPALILTGDEIAAVRAHIAAGDEPWRSAWRTFFDGRVQPLADAHPTPRTGPARAGSNESALRRYFAPFARDGSRARNFALAYGFSGDLYWARRARTFLLAWARNNEPTFFADSPNANTGQLQAYGAFSFAYAYDLVYGTLADADRTTIETYFRRLARAQQSCLRPQLRAISITALDALERYEWTTTGGQRLRYRALDRTVGGNFTLFMQVSTLALAYDAQFATKLAWLFDPANPLRVQRALDCSLAPVNEGDGTLSAVPALNILKGYQEGRGGTLDYSTYNARLASVILEIGRALAAIGYPAPTVANERPRLAATWSYLARFFGPEALPSPNPRDHVNLEADLPRFALAYRDLGDERFLAVLDSGPRAFYYEPQLLGPVTLTHSLPPAVDAPAPAEAMRAARLVQ